MTNRWWLFLIALWTFTLILAVPLLLLPAGEVRTEYVDSLVPGVTSISVIQKKPFLDWSGRHIRYSVEVVTQDGMTRYGTSSSPYFVLITQTGIELISSAGKIHVPPIPPAKIAPLR